MQKFFKDFFGPRLNGVLGFLLRSSIHGIVVTIFYGWFVAPYAHLPKLRLPMAMGLYLIVAFVKRDYRPDLARKSQRFDYDNEGDVARLYSIMALRAMAALTAGWIIHLFV